MKQQDWIELFKEINDREPNNEELLEALQKGEIVEGIDEEYNEPLFEEINDDKAQLEYDYQKNYSESNEEKLINKKSVRIVVIIIELLTSFVNSVETLY